MNALLIPEALKPQLYSEQVEPGSRSPSSEIADDMDMDKTCVNIVAPHLVESSARRYGRYEVIRKLGEGGMGTVYLARDSATGDQVALKVLSDACLKQEDSFHRFEKEVRLLEEAHNPYIANMLDVGVEGESRFLVMEFVDGCDLRRWLKSRQQLEEPAALEILADLCRALSSIHARGMVHRDIKPENVLLTRIEGPDRPIVKLTDFGLARHVDQTESMKLTHTGALLGTPLYMAPEQFKGTGEVSPATDVYALGITLFELLAGQRPFKANDPIRLATAHCFDAPPELKTLAATVSDGVSDLVNRMLAKNPASRPPDAAALLEEIVRLQSGQATELDLHPALPPHDATKVIENVFEWDLESSPQELWQYVSNTDRFNQAAGIPPVEYETVRNDAGQLQKFGQFRMAGMNIKWEEHPFEWIEGHRFSILREFSSGPFVWFLSTVELEARPDGGTHLRHHVRILPNRLAGRMLAGLEVGIKGRRNLDRIYRRIDGTLRNRSLNQHQGDHFQQAPGLSRVQRLRLRTLLDEIRSAGVNEEIVATLQNVVTHSAAQDLAHLRPYVIARRFGLPERDVVDAFLYAVQCGLLIMRWELICPTCRLTADSKQTLREIDQHANCEACHSDFKLDFGSSIELVFMTPPDVRVPETRRYCNGGPGNFPHVAAQIALEPGERLLMTLSLEPGSYIVRGPRLPYTVLIDVDSRDGVRQGNISCAPGHARQPTLLLNAAYQQLSLDNQFSERQLIRIERSVRRSDALTAVEATSLPLFNRLFPQETLDPGQLMQLATTNFLVIQMDHLEQLFEDEGDSGAYVRTKDFLQIATRQIRSGGGNVIDEHPGMLLASFSDITHAFTAAQSISDELAIQRPDFAWSVSGSLHRGNALVTSDRRGTRYFGIAVNDTIRLSRRAFPGTLLLTYDVWSCPAALTLLADHLRPFSNDSSDTNESLRQVTLNHSCGAAHVATTVKG